MLYNLDKTRLFANKFNTYTVDFPYLITNEGGGNDLRNCPNLVEVEHNRTKYRTECISGDAYASIHQTAGQTQKSGDALFAINKGNNYQVVLTEMKFRCTTKGSCESLASDIIKKTNSTKQLFCGICFYNEIYILVNSKEQRLLNTLQRQLIAKKIYKVITLSNLEDKFFKP